MDELTITNGQEYFDFIELQLKNFGSKIPNLGYAINLVNTCKPILSKIKLQLGENDDRYIKISGNVASSSWENLVIFLAEEKKIFNFLLHSSDSTAFDVYTILSKRREQNSPYNRDNFIEILAIATSLSLKGPTIWGSGILSTVLCDGGGTNIAVAKSNFLSVIQESKDLMQSIAEFDMDSETRGRYSEMTELVENLYETISNLSISEPPKPAEPKSGCYIATMAYGDYDHPQVLILRNFRDSTLTKYLFGRLFIKFYYRISPTLVRYLQSNQSIKSWSRRILDTLIKKYL